MKKLDQSSMLQLNGEGACKVSGLAVGFAVTLAVAGIATGGIFWGVAAGLSAYAGGVTGFVCAMQ